MTVAASTMHGPASGRFRHSDSSMAAVIDRYQALQSDYTEVSTGVDNSHGLSRAPAKAAVDGPLLLAVDCSAAEVILSRSCSTGSAGAASSHGNICEAYEGNEQRSAARPGPLRRASRSAGAMGSCRPTEPTADNRRQSDPEANMRLSLLHQSQQAANVPRPDLVLPPLEVERNHVDPSPSLSPLVSGGMHQQRTAGQERDGRRKLDPLPSSSSRAVLPPELVTSRSLSKPRPDLPATLRRTGSTAEMHMVPAGQQRSEAGRLSHMASISDWKPPYGVPPECIVNHTIAPHQALYARGPALIFRVRWQGFPPDADTWEPYVHLEGTGALTSYFQCYCAQLHAMTQSQRYQTLRRLYPARFPQFQDYKQATPPRSPPAIATAANRVGVAT
mmetsp:Transcript_266/g.823  ORF Transcript_266/g.823 Transcript_266/m.823 type:complete len:389 (-) Transcript_266:179-1345(-)|eukprot:CAMPEP_0117665218 /NCGR_PEP_ID=MMETSP0804-20121206/9686_1 /TAXON_ID=1074897 /ORGANISM="Tetraselmis astigmatica, Strain CCMP880" /LENGTH=388 /DNA_ID=CAMNT_0005472603 /DNA_START=475 /DNA_END=1641 /DNA_ORIENTATION=+